MAIEKNITVNIKDLPLPVMLLDADGKVKDTSERIGEVFAYDELEGADFYALTNIRYDDLSDETKTNLSLSRKDRTFRVYSEMTRGGMLVYFQDVTNFETLKDMYNSERTCVMIVSVDNYDEAVEQTNEKNVSSFTSVIDKTIREWASTMSAAVTQYKRSMYNLVVESEACEEVIEGKFAILDKVRDIETEADFPVTLSIGIGIGGKTPEQTDEFAGDALKLALGRGGDQAVVMRGSKVEYYGGKVQTVANSNKGKSRIFGHALKQLMLQSDKIFVMGHRDPDIDSFGSALGIFRFAESTDKDTYIVIGRYNDDLVDVVEQAKATGVYNFVSAEKAQELATDDSLVIVVDTHIPSRVEAPALLEITPKVVVIDHHRLAEEYIENPVLSYMEPYASSASELVAEINQFVGEKKALQKLEAEALLGGITVDTNRFAVKTGVRTFEAATWLRRNGADPMAVKRFFNMDPEDFRMKAECIASAEILDGGYAVAVFKGPHPNIQILNAQAADELLDMKGMKASFVVGLNADGMTVVSARSLGGENVQVIMERFGGGGHLTTAGTQLDMSPEEFVQELKAYLAERSENK